MEWVTVPSMRQPSDTIELTMVASEPIFWQGWPELRE